MHSSSRSPGDGPDGQAARPGGAEASLELLERARAGDKAALDRLLTRYRPRLVRWAAGRLPRWARDLCETQDVVQEVLLRSFTRVSRFEPRGEGALLAYLRQGVHNRIRDEIRRVGRRPEATALDSQQRDLAPSPFEDAEAAELLDRYEAALARLRAEEREAIIARVEMGYTYEEVAVALGKPTAGAARQAVSRALVRLAEEMGHEE